METLTVSAVNLHIATLFEQDDLLRNIAVVGEVSNWKRAASGHVYFNLKDSGANLSSVMWRGSVQSHSWLPRDGDQVIAFGYVGVYPERGVYQLYANRLQPAGRGQLFAQFEALKAKLAAEGLFDAARKRPLPAQIDRIGVVTSPDAAALRDILRVFAQRWPLVQVILFPTPVQGNDAPAKIVDALATANRFSRDVEPLQAIILARGGGSIEDLWSFNDERVAYAVAGSELPVITGVGHETDFTIVDFVADLRAPTPTAAATAVVPDRDEARARLRSAAAQMLRRVEQGLEAEGAALDLLAQRLHRTHPERVVDRYRQSLDDRDRRLAWAMQHSLDRLKDRTRTARQRLEALSPQAVLLRGYSVVQRQSGEVVTQPAGLVPDEVLSVRAAGGSYCVTVASAPN
jgi:exodeoxyribonuclease VII large subunit